MANQSQQEERCRYSYKIEATIPTTVCSFKALSQSQFEQIERQYKESLNLFPGFLVLTKEKTVLLKGAKPITIYIVPKDSLHRYDDKTKREVPVIGTFTNVSGLGWHGKSFINIDETKINTNNKVIAHEVAHWLSSLAGYSESEDIARQFEDYFCRYYSHRWNHDEGTSSEILITTNCEDYPYIPVFCVNR